MASITIHLTLTEDYKKKAVDTVVQTINEVSKKNNIDLSEQEKRKIKNLSLDQVNVNVTQKNKLKTMWVFDVENKYPVLIEIKENVDFDTLSKDSIYKMKNNGEWEIAEIDKKNLDKETFEKVALDNLLKDFETAAFYGTLSYEDEYEGNDSHE